MVCQVFAVQNFKNTSIVHYSISECFRFDFLSRCKDESIDQSNASHHPISKAKISKTRQSYTTVFQNVSELTSSSAAKTKPLSNQTRFDFFYLLTETRHAVINITSDCNSSHILQVCLASYHQIF